MIKEYLTFDDVLLLPNYSEVLPSEVNLECELTKSIRLNIPLVSSAMDTVTESEMAILMAQNGGIGIIHKNMTIDEQVEEVKKVKKEKVKSNEIATIDKDNKLIVGAAVSVNENSLSKIDKLYNAGCDVIVIDSAHGHSLSVMNLTQKVKEVYPNKDLIVGNVVTKNAIKDLAKLNVDGIKVGIGSGSICTTRIVSGVGAPQLTALRECIKEARKYNIPIIADGGIKYSGDIVKALAAGASCVMLGSMLAGHDQNPGKVVKIEGEKFKSFVGMGSQIAMERGGGDRYFQSELKKYVPEGVEALKEYKGDADDTLYQILGGIRSGMGYNGAKTIKDLFDNANFVKISHSSILESHPHSIKHMKGANNYNG